MDESQYAPGIPARVADYADSYKKRFEDNATTSSTSTRKESPDQLPVLPPGVGRETFNQAIVELKKVVNGHVELVDGELKDGWYLDRPLTHDAFALGDQDDYVNSAICSPGNVEEVQSVVRWANKWLIPIYPISMGRNLGKSSHVSFDSPLMAIRLWRCSSPCEGLCCN